MGSAHLPIVYVVTADSCALDGLCALLYEGDWTVRAFGNSEEFLAGYHPGRDACLVIGDLEIGNCEMLFRLGDDAAALPIIVLTDADHMPEAVAALKAGVSDVIAKPVYRGELLPSVVRALERSREANRRAFSQQSARSRIAMLTPRQKEVMQLVLAGYHNKNIAAKLGVSQRTVENHRATIMRHTNTKSLPELARLAIAAAWTAEAEALLREANAEHAAEAPQGKSSAGG